MIAGIALLIPAGLIDGLALRALDFPVGLLAGAALLVAILFVFVSPGRRYESWGYAAEADELHIRKGIFVREHVVLPFGRVQHIDLSQGPVERHYGVATLTLHTAGTRNSAVALPGLAREDAERMRDEIRGKIRQDLA